MLFLLLVGFNLLDGFFLGVALSLSHLLSAENEDLFLLLMFALDDVLESCDQLFDLPIRVSPDFLVFKEARNFIIFFK